VAFALYSWHADLAERLNERGLPGETEASIEVKLRRGTFPAMSLPACLALLDFRRWYQPISSRLLKNPCQIAISSLFVGLMEWFGPNSWAFRGPEGA
jgi:hypothetical protein